MGTIADLLVVVVYCLGVYTLLGVVAALFEWWAARSRRAGSRVMGYSGFSKGKGRARVHRQKAPEGTVGLSGVYGP